MSAPVLELQQVTRMIGPYASPIEPETWHTILWVGVGLPMILAAAGYIVELVASTMVKHEHRARLER